VSALTFEGVSLELGGRAVLSDIDLEVRQGEFVGVLGANGAGKTTLMRAVLGLVPPARGKVSVLGRPAMRGNPDVGYLPQAHGLGHAVRLRASDVVAAAMNGHRPGLPILNRAARREVDRAFELVGAERLAGRCFHELSGGERQRVLLAQAVLGSPRLLLLDEPLISLDPHHQSEVVHLVKNLQRELGIAVLFSAHELNPLLAVLDRVLYLGGGHAALGSVAEVVTPAVLSRLYGSPIDVVRVGRHIFVMAGSSDIERDAHRHRGETQAHAGAADGAAVGA